MDERLTEEGIEHLQAAARELISAARIFLDVVEDLVEEPERVTQSLAGVVDVFKDMTGRAAQPWEAHAWSASSGPGSSDDRSGTRGQGDRVGGRARRNDRRRKEPTLFPTDVDAGGEDHPVGHEAQDDPRIRGGEHDSDWAVWDDDEPSYADDSLADEPLGPVVDIRTGGQRSTRKTTTREDPIGGPSGRGRSSAKDHEESNGTKASRSSSRRSTVKRITVD